MHGILTCSQASALPRCLGIVAIDLGKFNSVLCIFDPATAVHSFVTLATDRKSLTDVLDKIPSQDRPSTLVVFETCEISGWVYDLISPMGFKIAVANPATEAWRWTKVKRKTDRDDALKLAKLASMKSTAHGAYAQLLMSVPGVGIGLATTVVVHLDDPVRFSSAAKGWSVRRTHSPAGSKRREQPLWSHHAKRPEPLKRHADRGGVGGLPPQSMGKDFVNRVSRGNQGQKEDRDCSISKEAADQALGDAARQQTLARPHRNTAGGRGNRVIQSDN